MSAVERAAEIIGRDYGPYENKDGIDASVIAAQRLADAGLLEDEASVKLGQVTTLLELALDGRSSAAERGDPLEVAMRAHDTIKRLRKVKAELLDALLVLRSDLEAEG